MNRLEAYLLEKLDDLLEGNLRDLYGEVYGMGAQSPGWMYARAPQAQFQMPQNLGQYQQQLAAVQWGLGQCGCRACDLDRPSLQTQWDREAWEEWDMRRSQAQHRAEEKSDRLLYRFLTPEQRLTLEELAFFDVVGKGRLVGRLGFRRTQTRTFRIYWAGPMVDELLPSGKRQHLCIMALDSIPRSDIMLAWKLLIEADLPRFLKTANRIGGPR